MLSAPLRLLSLSSCFLLAQCLTFASSITVNGSCAAGTCPAVDTLAPDNNITPTNFSFATLVNGDLYDVFGEFAATNPPSGDTTIQFNATVVYEGTTPTAQTDVLIIDDLQDYTVFGGLSGTYFEDTAAAFGGMLGGDSSLSAQLSFNGQGLGELGPFVTLQYQSLSKDITLSGTSLAADFNFSFDFGTGTTEGSYITTTPEPTGMVPVAAIVALGLGVPAIRRSRLFSGAVN